MIDAVRGRSENPISGPSGSAVLIARAVQRRGYSAVFTWSLGTAAPYINPVSVRSERRSEPSTEQKTGVEHEATLHGRSEVGAKNHDKSWTLIGLVSDVVYIRNR